MIINEHIIPDPLTLKKGWFKEDDNGFVKWPSVYFHDIATYFKTKTSAELIKHLANEYKVGKAFRYFSSGWVKEVLYHDIDPKSHVCILKCKVTPSQQVLSRPYNVWAVIEKDTEKQPVGKIVSCYCTCTAGLYGVCNHAAGLLFRVESAVMAGITNPSCTDRLAKWTVPNAKTDLKCCPVSSMQFTKDHYKSFTTMDRSNQERNVKARAAFSPLSQEQQQYIRNESQVRRDLMNIIKIHAPKSCFVELISEKKLSVKSKEPTPKSIVDKVDDFKVDKAVTMEQNIKNFTRACNLTESERDIINRNTVGQSSVNDWHDQQKGKVTALRFTAYIQEV